MFVSLSDNFGRIVGVLFIIIYGFSKIPVHKMHIPVW